MLRFFAVEMDGESFAAGFGAWLLLWFLFTLMLSWATWYINLPAFLASALLAVGYLLFGLANLTESETAARALSTAGGWVLIADGLVAWYLSLGARG